MRGRLETGGLGQQLDLGSGHSMCVSLCLILVPMAGESLNKTDVTSLCLPVLVQWAHGWRCMGPW